MATAMVSTELRYSICNHCAVCALELEHVIEITSRQVMIPYCRRTENRGMWRTRFAQAVNWLRSRRLVGEDGRHEFYAEYVGSGVPEKRYVEFKDRDITDSSSGMPTEWWAWLHNRRDEPPTVAEIAASKARAERLAKRVRALEEEDARQRLRQFAGAAAPKDDASDVRRERVKERLLRSANETTAATHVSHSKPGSVQQTQQKSTGEGTEAFEPESWTPPTTKWRR